jgi:hypothetical protein
VDQRSGATAVWQEGWPVVPLSRAGGRVGMRLLRALPLGAVGRGVPVRGDGHRGAERADAEADEAARRPDQQHLSRHCADGVPAAGHACHGRAVETDAPGQTGESVAPSLLYPVGRVATVIVMADSELVPTADAARQIGISSRTLARYAQQGVVRPAVVLPSGHLRWDVADLRRQLSELHHGGSSDAR